MSSHDRASRFMDISLELTGSPDVGKRDKLSIKKLAKNQTQLRFIVQNLPSILEGDTADSLTALVIDEMERLPVPGRLARVQIAAVKLTKEGSVSLSGFLTGYANTIRHVALHALLNHAEDGSKSIIQEDMRHIKQVISAFALSPLSVLDLSQNSLNGSEIWKAWLPTPRDKLSLKQLILDSVDLNEESWLTLERDLTTWDTMEDLHIVLEYGPPSEDALKASLSIMRQCQKLASLRWIQRRNPDRSLPWTGLRDMAGASTRGLRHLVLEGPGTIDFVEAHDWADFSSAMKEFTRLKTLKLRHLGLVDVAMLVASLKAARPPLEVIDLSYNEISGVGAARLSDLKRVPRLSDNLKALILNDNRLDTAVARDLLFTFGSVCSLQNNPGVDFTQLVSELLSAKGTLERERDDLRHRLETRGPGGGSNGGAVPSLESLQQENRLLRQERDILSQAFQITGHAKEVEEARRLLERVQRLEDMMVMNAVLKGGANGGAIEVAMGGKNSSRRRITASELERLTQAVAHMSIGGRNLSGRALNRSWSGRSAKSTASRGANNAEGSEQYEEAGAPITELPRRSSEAPKSPNNHSAPNGRNNNESSAQNRRGPGGPSNMRPGGYMHPSTQQSPASVATPSSRH